MYNVVVAVYKRYDYLRRFLKSVALTSGNENIFYSFCDDYSQDPRIEEAIKAANLPHFEIISNSCNLGYLDNVHQHIVFNIKQSSKFVVVLDPDTVHHPEWFNEIVNIYNQFSSVAKIAAVTPYLFHEAKIIETLHKPNSNVAHSVDYIPGCAVLIDIDFFNTFNIENGYMPEFPTVKCMSWDWQIVYKAIKNNYLLLSTPVSYVQHIGDVGIHGKGCATHQSINYVGNLFN